MTSHNNYPKISLACGIMDPFWVWLLEWNKKTHPSGYDKNAGSNVLTAIAILYTSATNLAPLHPAPAPPAENFPTPLESAPELCADRMVQVFLLALLNLQVLHICPGIWVCAIEIKIPVGVKY